MFQIEAILQRNNSPKKFATDQCYRLQQSFLTNELQQVMIYRTVICYFKPVKVSAKISFFLLCDLHVYMYFAVILLIQIMDKAIAEIQNTANKLESMNVDSEDVLEDLTETHCLIKDASNSKQVIHCLCT